MTDQAAMPSVVTAYPYWMGINRLNAGITELRGPEWPMQHWQADWLQWDEKAAKWLDLSSGWNGQIADLKTPSAPVIPAYRQQPTR